MSQGVQALLARIAEPRLRPVLGALVGATLPLGFAPFHLWPIPILALALLVLLLDGLSPRRAALVGTCWGAGAFLAGTYWLYHSLHVLGGAPIFFALILMVGLVLIMALYSGLFAWVLRRLDLGPLLTGLVAAPGAWVVIEWVRGWFLSGFPWLSQGYAQVDAPLGGYAGLAGVYGVSLACAISAGALTALLRVPRPRAWIPALALAGVWIPGLVLEHHAWTQPSGEPLRVALVQGNVAQEDKWDPDFLFPTMDLYMELSEPHWDADLVVWPEAAIPALMHQIDEYFLPEMQARAEAGGAELVLGLLRREDGGYYNSLVALREGSVYSKRRLVPFGEYFPIPEFLKTWIRLPYADISAGPQEGSLLPTGPALLGATICYEDAYGQDQMRAVREAELLINVSNDAWFGTSIAPHQHLQVARMRAREAGLPLIRVTNTGITAIIGPAGELLATIPQFEPGVLVGEVAPHRSGRTPFSIWGDWLAIGLAGVLLLVAIWLSRRDP